MKGNGTAGHLSALLTIIIWGTTFISTKILLAVFQPVEILFFRFVLGLLALLLTAKSADSTLLFIYHGLV